SATVRGVSRDARPVRRCDNHRLRGRPWLPRNDFPLFCPRFSRKDAVFDRSHATLKDCAVSICSCIKSIPFSCTRQRRRSSTQQQILSFGRKSFPITATFVFSNGAGTATSL